MKRPPLMCWPLILCAACGDASHGADKPMQAEPDLPEQADAGAVDAGALDAGLAEPGDAAQTSIGDASLAYAFPCLGSGSNTHAATFEAVYVEIFCKIGCAHPYCHGSYGAWQGLDLTTIPGAYAALVGQEPGRSDPVDGRPTCRESKLLRVEPGAPERSLLYLKVSGAPPCGTAMPPPSAGLSALDDAQIDQIRRWILAGAPLGN